MAPGRSKGNAEARNAPAARPPATPVRAPVPVPIERRRGTGAGLSQDVLVEAATRIVRQEGTEGLTMRRLADELGVAPMAAYHHVRGRDDLLSLVGDAVFRASRKADPLPEDAPWPAQLRHDAHRTFDTLAAHPGLGAFLQERPLSPYFREGRRHDVARLVAAGLPPADAAEAAASFRTFLFGLCSMETSLRPLKRPRGTTTAILVDVPVNEFIDFGVDILIDGIRSRLAAQ